MPTIPPGTFGALRTDTVTVTRQAVTRDWSGATASGLPIALSSSSRRSASVVRVRYRFSRCSLIAEMIPWLLAGDAGAGGPALGGRREQRPAHDDPDDDRERQTGPAELAHLRDDVGADDEDEPERDEAVEDGDRRAVQRPVDGAADRPLADGQQRDAPDQHEQEGGDGRDRAVDGRERPGDHELCREPDDRRGVRTSRRDRRYRGYAACRCRRDGWRR